jgi:HK97 family phage prohead protease
MTEVLSRADAAQMRSLKYAAETSRPRERGAEPGAYQVNRAAGQIAAPTPSIRAAIHIERAAAGSVTPDAIRFDGFASVTGKPYQMYDWLGEYDEVVAPEAFDETLAREDLEVPLVLQHDSMRRIAQLGNAASPLILSAEKGGDPQGLRSVAPTLQLSDPDTAYIVPKMELGLIDEMSFRFTIEQGRWSGDFTTFTIQRVNIHRGDVAIVGYGANPMTTGAGLRAQVDPAQAAARAYADANSRATDGRFAHLVR